MLSSERVHFNFASSETNAPRHPVKGSAEPVDNALPNMAKLYENYSSKSLIDDACDSVIDAFAPIDPTLCELNKLEENCKSKSCSTGTNISKELVDVKHRLRKVSDTQVPVVPSVSAPATSSAVSRDIPRVVPRSKQCMPKKAASFANAAPLVDLGSPEPSRYNFGDRRKIFEHGKTVSSGANGNGNSFNRAVKCFETSSKAHKRALSDVSAGAKDFHAVKLLNVANPNGADLVARRKEMFESSVTQQARKVRVRSDSLDKIGTQQLAKAASVASQSNKTCHEGGKSPSVKDDAMAKPKSAEQTCADLEQARETSCELAKQPQSDDAKNEELVTEQEDIPIEEAQRIEIQRLTRELKGLRERDRNIAREISKLLS